MKGCFNVEITFAEMYSGVGGIRYGLEKSNKSSNQTQIGQGTTGIQLDEQCIQSNGDKSLLEVDRGQGQIDNRNGETTRANNNRELLQGKENEGVQGSTNTERRQARFTCVWANDIDKYACQIYRKNFGDKELIEGDIRTVDPKSIPDFDLLTAGFPCQSHSVAGERKGFADPRGTLFYEIARIAKAKRPKLLLLENVAGLLSTKAAVSTGIYRATEGKGKGELTDDFSRVKDEPERGWEEVKTFVGKGYCFTEILFTLDEMGYNIEFQCLNSKDFSVPQNRERVFLIGHLRSEPSREIFPIGEPNSISAKNATNGQRIASCLDVNYHKGARRQRTFVIQEHSFSGKDGKGRGLREFKGIVPTLTQQMGTGGNNVPMVVNESENLTDVYYRAHAPNSPEKRWGKHHIKTSVCPTLSTDLAIETKDNQVLAVEMAHTKANMKEGRFSEICHALDGGKSKAVMIANTLDRDGYLRTGARPRDENGKPQLLPIGYRRIRRLTPEECELLQAFPIKWTEGVSDTQRYKLLGNAVTTTVIEFLGQHLSSLF